VIVFPAQKAPARNWHKHMMLQAPAADSGNELA